MSGGGAPPAGNCPGGRILIIEDDASIRLGLEINLRAAGYQVSAASDGPSGLRLARSLAPDLIVLDLRLPNLHGFDLLAELRRDGFTAPVLILSALQSEEDKVAGLRLGGDDYVTKPFSVLELTARVEALLRRARPGGQSRGVVRFGEVEIDLPARIVRRAGATVHLTPKELDLLEVLVRTPGRAHTRESLLERIWGRGYEGTERTVDNFMTNLRRKLEPVPGEPRYLVTVRGMGYRFDP